MVFSSKIALLDRTAIAFFGDETVEFFDDVEEYSIKGIFDKEYEITDTNTQASVISSLPVVHIRRADLKHEILEEESLRVAGTAYFVNEIHDDGKGLLTVFLHEDKDAQA